MKSTKKGWKLRRNSALLFDVANISGKPKITNFEVVDDKDGAIANNFLKQAVKNMKANCYTKNFKCLTQYKLGLKFAEAENWKQTKFELPKPYRFEQSN